MRRTRRLTLLLAFTLLLGVLSIPGDTSAYGWYEGTATVGVSKFNDFINDPEHRDGIPWDSSTHPKLSSGGSTGCAAYCVDFTKYCYGYAALTSKDVYTDPNEIRAGDIMYLHSEYGHYVAILARDGNWLYTAEGSWPNRVRVGWNYYIDGDNVEGRNRDFVCGYHFEPSTKEGTWKHNSGGWWYEYWEGCYAEETWLKISGKWYYFDEDDYMVTGWKKFDTRWYYFGNSGAMQTEWKKIDGKWYYLGRNGIMVKGWRMIDGEWYYFTGGGAMVNGWKKLSGTWYYFAGGAMVTGWKCIGGKWYYFDQEGSMQEGWLKEGGKTYYLDNGAMVTGTLRIDDVEYTFRKDGSLDDDFHIAE